MDYDTLEDGQLLPLIAGGDKAAFAALYDRYARKVFSVARHMLRDHGRAEEVTQEVFLTLWQKAGTYRPERGGVRAWIMSVSHNRVIDLLRQQRRNPPPLNESESSEVLSYLPSQVRTEEEAEKGWESDRVQAALKRLPPEQGEAIALAYYQGYSQSEIAERLGQPLGTVKTRMRLAMQKLRASLEEPRD